MVRLEFSQENKISCGITRWGIKKIENDHFILVKSMSAGP